MTQLLYVGVRGRKWVCGVGRGFSPGILLPLLCGQFVAKCSVSVLGNYAHDRPTQIVLWQTGVLGVVYLKNYVRFLVVVSFLALGQILRESCWVFSSDIINAACSMPEFILAGSKLLTQFSILLKFVFSAIMQVDGIWL